MGHHQPEQRPDPSGTVALGTIPIQPSTVALGAGAARQAVTPPPPRRPQGTLPARRRQAALPAGHAQPDPLQPPVPGPAPAPDPARPARVLPAPLPPAVSVLAVIARPGQESADLGAVLAAFSLSGARLSVLCLTRGEASELNSTPERLETVRPWELQVAANLLRISSVTVADYPDGRLSYLPPPALAAYISRSIRQQRADLLLVVDPGAVLEPDTAATAQATCLAARGAGLPVLARTQPGPGSRWEVHLGDHASAVRTRQHHAIRAHASQFPLARPLSAQPGPAAADPPGPGLDPAAAVEPPATWPGPGTPADLAGPGQNPPLAPPPLSPATGQPDFETVRWLVSPFPA